MPHKFSLYFIFGFLFIFLSCDNDKKGNSAVDQVNWEKRKVNHTLPSALISGSTYLSVYSEIYSMSEHTTHDLTATISLRNISHEDTVYIKKATYYDTDGHEIRTYFAHPIFLKPFETVEIVIDQADKSGGTGGNFEFIWMTKNGVPEPMFEAIMISTSGQQGISFVTTGKRIR